METRLANTSDAVTVPAAAAAVASPLRVFWATWAGWMLDSFDATAYGLLLVSILSELLPLSGLQASEANIARYGGPGFSIFILGWSCSMFWGWLADRIGRVRTMCITILVYSIFTALCGLASGIESFLVLRFLVGFGVGGEWAAGTPLLHESVPESMRVKLTGLLHTASPVGVLLASAVALLIVPVVGWRGMFLFGLLPALLALYLRRRIPEPPRRVAPPGLAPVKALFSRGQASVTWPAALMAACALLGIWSSGFWIPTLVTTRFMAAGYSLPAAQQIASFANLLANVGTLVGCLVMPWTVRIIQSRRRVAALFFALSLAGNIGAYYGVVERLNDIWLFLACVPLLGFATSGVFALFTIWLPEMFPAATRGSGLGFTFSFGRILAAAGPLMIGVIAGRTGSYPIAISLISLIYAPGLLLVFLSQETAGMRLPH